MRCTQVCSALAQLVASMAGSALSPRAQGPSCPGTETGARPAPSPIQLYPGMVQFMNVAPEVWEPTFEESL